SDLRPSRVLLAWETSSPRFWRVMVSSSRISGSSSMISALLGFMAVLGKIQMLFRVHKTNSEKAAGVPAGGLVFQGCEVDGAQFWGDEQPQPRPAGEGCSGGFGRLAQGCR